MMNRIVRIDEKLKEITKPSLKKIQDIRLMKGDVFIVCAGFEERATEAFKRTISSESSGAHVLIIDYLPFVKENRLDEIISICRSRSLQYDKIVYDRQNPAEFTENFHESLWNKQGRIYIDISGMSRLLIVQLLVTFFQKKPGSLNVSIIYSEATVYPPTKEEVDKQYAESTENLSRTVMFLSSGVFEVAIVPELSSVAMQGQPIHLITFPSFNIQQLVALRSEIQPHCYTFIHGIPLLEENQWRTDAIRKLNDIGKIPRKEEYYLSTFDYQKTLNTLLDIYGSCNGTERIIIAPTGSKMQAVAVGIFRSFLGDTQIVYPTPISFQEPTRYTMGIRQIYALNLDTFRQQHLY